MVNFFRALAYAGPAAINAYNKEDEAYAAQQKRKTQDEADKAYGGTIGDVFGAVPLPPAVTGTLNQPYPQAPMPGQPPGQTMPGAPPPGAPTMQTGAPVPMPMPKPGSPTAAIPGATPMPQGAMASAPSFSQNGQDASNGVINEFGSPSPQGSPMAAPGQNALGQAGQWDLRTFVSRMKAQYPNLSPEALGAAVDRAMPWFNMQSQADARVLRAQLEQAKQDSLNAWRQRKGDHADDELKLRQQREARFAAAATAASKLPPALKAQHDLLRNEYQAAETAFNVASRNLSYMTADMPGYDQAVEAYQQAQGVRMYATEKYENFVNNMPGAPRVPTTPQDQPQAGPAAAPAQAAPPASALPPGALETLPQGFKPKPVGIQGLNSYAPFTAEGGPLIAGSRGATAKPFPTTRDANVPEGEDPSRIPGMYGYDEQGRELPAPTPGQGGFRVEPVKRVIGYDADHKPNLFDQSPAPGTLETLPQGHGAPNQNRGAEPDSQLLGRPGATAPAMGPATALARGQSRQARFDKLRPQNDPEFQQSRRNAANFNAESNKAESAVGRLDAWRLLDHVEQLRSALHEFVQGPDPLTRMSEQPRKRKPKTVPYGAARGS